MRVYKFLCAHFGLKTLSEKLLKISTLDDLNDPFELLPYEMSDPNMRKAMRDAIKEWGANHGVICFSKDWKDPVMWAHYSDKHKGLCFGFEIPDNTGVAIKYVDSRMPMKPLTELIEIGDSNAWLYTKYENWAYEKEIRSWTDLTTPSGDLYFLDFSERLKLIEVVVGARCELTKSEVLDALKPLENVRLVKARAGFERFEIVEDQRGFTQMELAKALGTTQRVISYYETKGELPPPDFLVALVRTLGASADELLGLKPSKIEHRKEDPKRRRLWKRFRKMTSLPERDQRAVIRLINSLAGSKTQERASA